MYKKLILLISNLICCIILVNCLSNTSANENSNLKIGFNDYYANYNGYIDQVAMFDNKYDNQDYDGDGLDDRIYRKVFDVASDGGIKGSNSSYRIDFGNGDKLEIGNFDDIFTGIQIIGYDLTGDGVNEIIFCGKHEAITFPPAGSEIAVYKKKENGYKMMSLPRQDDWTDIDKFNVGYSFYKLKMKDNKVTIYSPKLYYKDTLVLEGKDEPIYDAFDFFKEAPYNQSVTSPAWRLKVEKYNQKPSLVIYNHLDSRYYDKDLATYLTWQDGEFKPVKLEIVSSLKDSIAE